MLNMADAIKASKRANKVWIKWIMKSRLLDLNSSSKALNENKNAHDWAAPEKLFMHVQWGGGGVPLAIQCIQHIYDTNPCDGWNCFSLARFLMSNSDADTRGWFSRFGSVSHD